jgi:hypothetical protein
VNDPRPSTTSAAIAAVSAAAATTQTQVATMAAAYRAEVNSPMIAASRAGWSSGMSV